MTRIQGIRWIALTAVIIALSFAMGAHGIWTGEPWGVTR